MNSRHILIGVAALLAAQGGQTEQCQYCAAHQNWENWGEPTQAIAFPFVVVDDATTTYWASTFEAGYIGVQTLDAAGQKRVLFSIWGAQDARRGDPNTYCRTFGGEGEGYSCRSDDFKWRSGVLYTARVEFRGGWVRGSLTGGGDTVVLGEIRGRDLPDLGAKASNFIEQFGFGVTCETAPVTSAIFYRPWVDGSAVPPASEFFYEQCPRGFVNPHGDGVYVRFGGDDSMLSPDREERIAALLRSERTERLVPHLLSASHAIRQGFVRIVNRSALAGTVRIEASDDAGRRSEALTLSMDPDEAVHFNSMDLEYGAADKGLSGRTGSGEGDWRLDLSSSLDFDSLSYVRTSDGLLTAMHDVIPRRRNSGRVAIFNPGSNKDQVSRLRLINPGEEAAEITVRGTDDEGMPGAGEVSLSLDAGTAREITAEQLEEGRIGFAGTLGDGSGKWYLEVESEQVVVAMSLLESPTGHLTNLSAVPMEPPSAVHVVPLFPKARDEFGRQGFVRVINRDNRVGEVRVKANDETTRDYEPVTLTIGANQVTHFNSDDLEQGTERKGLSGGTGAGEGDWRLEMTSALDIEVLAYIRTKDGFLTSMHGVVPKVGTRHRVATFNPGSNTDRLSKLRLINLDAARAVRVSIVGRDDAGTYGADTVELTLPAGASRTIDAAQLEAGGPDFAGRLGDGSGKWRLWVEAEGDILVVNLLDSVSGHLANLSSLGHIID